MATSSGSLQPQLAAAREQLEAALAQAERLVHEHSESRLGARPAAGGWCALECLAHLTITSRQFLPLLAKATAKGAPRASESARFGLGLMGRLLMWTLEPPYRMKIKTPPVFRPEQTQTCALALADFQRAQQELFVQLERANGLALDKIMLRSPFDARVGYNLLASFLIIATHQRRHLWQAGRAMKAKP